MRWCCWSGQQEWVAAVVDEIQEYLCKALAESRRVPIAALDTLIVAGAEIDSLEGIELILAAERRYGVKLEDDVMSQVCRSIPHLARAVAARLPVRAAAD